ncbi:hypothetical protein TSAR_013583 [Trichomalopsis sarcophagae]|uniref:Uncharacterized protein n=1 Tax=Trichomalopsis sarcophagae TaxID=543379 RepID=A0A232EER3_9HYME|nr:hypothetical protein TSAR_013583 [Trichomalopsis sarcophagae]
MLHRYTSINSNVAKIHFKELPKHLNVAIVRSKRFNVAEGRSKRFNVVTDKNHTEYKNKTKKGKEWDKIAADLKESKPSVKTDPANKKLLSMSKKKNQIAEELLQMENKKLSLIEQSLSKSTVQNKWQSLLKTFRTEHNLVNSPRSGDGLEDVYTPSWTYETLRFLEKSSVANESAGNLDLIFAPEPSVKTDPANKKLLSMSKKKNQIAEELLQMENKKLSLIEQSLSSNECFASEKDKLHMSFFETLLPSLRQISDQDILVCRNDISEIVFKYAYKGAAWKSLNQDKVESARGMKRKTYEDDDCQIVSYIPPLAQLNHIIVSYIPPLAQLNHNVKIKEEKEEKYRPSLSERYVERRNCNGMPGTMFPVHHQSGTIIVKVLQQDHFHRQRSVLHPETHTLELLGRHARDHVSGTPPKWNNHSQSVTEGPFSPATISPPPRDS